MEKHNHMRIRTIGPFTIPGEGEYTFIHHQGAYGHLYEMLSTPANLVYNEALNPDTTFDQWVHHQVAHLLNLTPAEEAR